MRIMKILLGEKEEDIEELKNLVTELQNLYKQLKIENKNETETLRNQLADLQNAHESLKIEKKNEIDLLENQVTELENVLENHASRFQCKSPFIGDKCNNCAPGYFGYPACQGELNSYIFSIKWCSWASG